MPAAKKSTKTRRKAGKKTTGTQRIPRVLKDMLNLPTAPFVEDAVMAYLRRECRKLRHTTLKSDKHGNLLARYRFRPGRRQPLALTAHTDHPGFVSLAMTGEGAVRAAFRGWVEPQFFERTKVRFWDGARWIKGVVREITRHAPVYGMIGRTGRPEEVLIDVEDHVPANMPGMWDLPDATLRGRRVHARGCDDLAGAAALLEMLRTLSRRRLAADVYVLFTRAEEVGFVGAIAASKSRTIPKRCPVIAIETSKRLPDARQGEGPVLRVGDKSSIFNPDVTAYCNRVARKLMQRKRSFRFQRKLMDGGTCESTAYMVYGYQATGICVALGNYHNMDERRTRISPEHIHLDDWRNMVAWFVALAADKEGFRPAAERTREALEKRYDSYEDLLSA